MSEIVPAPTAWTDAAAPPLNILITMSIGTVLESADTAANMMDNPNESSRTLRRPNISEKPDHQIGKIAKLSIYKATFRFTIVGEAWSSSPIWTSEADEG